MENENNKYVKCVFGWIRGTVEYQEVIDFNKEDNIAKYIKNANRQDPLMERSMWVMKLDLPLFQEIIALPEAVELNLSGMVDDCGQTILHHMIYHNDYLEQVRWLVKSGLVDVNAKNSDGKTAWDLANNSTNHGLLSIHRDPKRMGNFAMMDILTGCENVDVPKRIFQIVEDINTAEKLSELKKEIYLEEMGGVDDGMCSPVSTLSRNLHLYEFREKCVELRKNVDIVQGHMHEHNERPDVKFNDYIGDLVTFTQMSYRIEKEVSIDLSDVKPPIEVLEAHAKLSPSFTEAFDDYDLPRLYSELGHLLRFKNPYNSVVGDLIERTVSLSFRGAVATFDVDNLPVDPTPRSFPDEMLYDHKIHHVIGLIDDKLKDPDMLDYVDNLKLLKTRIRSKLKGFSSDEYKDITIKFKFK